MKRAAGLTLIELMIAMVATAGAIGAAAAIVSTVVREERVSAAYARDLDGLRRAVTALEVDLRGAGSLDDVDWRLDGDRLLRGDETVARRIAEFELTADGGLARAAIAPAPRGGGAPRPAGRILLTVRMRNAGSGR